MLPIGLFRNRWRALSFAFFMCWWAYDWASDQPDSAPTATAAPAERAPLPW